MSSSPQDLISKLQDAYLAYMAAMKEVVDCGDTVVPLLVDALKSRHASPFAKALGVLMFKTEAARDAIPALLGSLIGGRPVYFEAVEAVVYAGSPALPYVIDELRSCASSNDDEGVRAVLDVGVRLPEDVLGEVADAALHLLRSGNPDIRGAAADAFGRLGLPAGSKAIRDLAQLKAADGSPDVRQAAADALRHLHPSEQ